MYKRYMLEGKRNCRGEMRAGIFGAVIGAAAAYYLFGTREGYRLQKKLKRAARDLKDKAQDMKDWMEEERDEYEDDDE